MKNTRLRLIYIFTALIFLAALVFSFILLRPVSARTVEIISGEEVLYTIDLSSAADQTVTVEYEGGSNLIEISDGKIRVKEADCSDNTCVKMGWLDSGAPIVCLPHRLVIRFTDSGDVDGAAR
ncbi:MAG: NusG domain II-containing protein [Firmicutes bacterium]|nr:NusG domain II-containing protein [[Eubacterium] siraeum]MCM1488981.1 NusG domain II-containing protein [Bacillota bacterium]